MSAKRILVVEDEENIRETLRYNLVKEGYRVDEARTGIRRASGSFPLSVRGRRASSRASSMAASCAGRNFASGLTSARNARFASS